MVFTRIFSPCYTGGRAGGVLPKYPVPSLKIQNAWRAQGISGGLPFVFPPCLPFCFPCRVPIVDDCSFGNRAGVLPDFFSPHKRRVSWYSSFACSFFSCVHFRHSSFLSRCTAIRFYRSRKRTAGKSVHRWYRASVCLSADTLRPEIMSMSYLMITRRWSLC